MVALFLLPRPSVLDPLRELAVILRTPRRGRPAASAARCGVEARGDKRESSATTAVVCSMSGRALISSASKRGFR